MTDHKQEALDQLKLAKEESDPHWSNVRVATAQTHATLALVEQQRIANIIAQRQR